jgi:hypothetical protein
VFSELGEAAEDGGWIGTIGSDRCPRTTDLLRHRQGRVECVAQELGGITGSAKMSDGDWLDDGFVLGSD